MSSTFMNTEIAEARKPHKCDACAKLLEHIRHRGKFNVSDLSYAEKRDVVMARRNNWTIPKGDLYFRVTGMCEDSWVSYAVMPAIDAICVRLSLYDE